MTPAHSTNTIIKFADDTTVVGLIHNGDESACRDEVCRLTDWCSTNNLALNIPKTKKTEGGTSSQRRPSGESALL